MALNNVKLTDLCADCCASDPTWASLSLGVLLCKKCATVHFTLGRHISILTLVGPDLPLVQRRLLETLSSKNINSVWEHLLLDSSYTGAAKKPSPADNNLHPTRSTFIKSKYVHMNFIERLPNYSTQPEVNKRLYNAVRTDDVEATLQLIVQGADIRAIDPESKATPLHAAVDSLQSLQVELLLIHGADPRTQDSSGRSAIDLARERNWQDLSHQLTSHLSRVTTRLEKFISEVSIDYRDMPQVKIGDLKPDAIDELCRDIYDELERRDLIKLLSCEDVPFLPVNPNLSSVRNQSRQKLARMPPNVLSLLANYVLDMSRISSKMNQFDDDDEPLYDSVASDDDDVKRPRSMIEVTSSLTHESSNNFIRSMSSSPTPSAASLSLSQAAPASLPANISHNWNTTSSLEAPIFYPNLLVKTEAITKHIHALLLAAKNLNDTCYMSIVKQIRSAVLEMSYLMPQSYPETQCKESLESLLTSADELFRQCENLLGDPDKSSTAQTIVKLAYNVAQNVKIFVTSFPHLKNTLKPVIC